MQGGYVGKLGRGLGWLAITIVAIALGIAIAVVPLSFLPGLLHTDFVQGDWVRLVGLAYLIAAFSWRLSPIGRATRFSFKALRRFLWLAVSAFALAFWPLGIIVWINGWGTTNETYYDLVIVEYKTTTVRPAVTPIETYIARDPRSGWTTDLIATPERKHNFRMGDCVTVAVKSGRLGLDWIEDAKVRRCQ